MLSIVPAVIIVWSHSVSCKLLSGNMFSMNCASLAYPLYLSVQVNSFSLGHYRFAGRSRPYRVLLGKFSNRFPRAFRLCS